MSFSKADFMERNIEAGKDHKSFVILILCTELQAGVFGSPSIEICLNYVFKAPSLTGTHKLPRRPVPVNKIHMMGKYSNA